MPVDGTDELNFPERPHQDRWGRSIRQANQMSISPTEITKPFNAVNNASGDYKTSCTNRWKPIKTHITEDKVLPREALKPQ